MSLSVSVLYAESKKLCNVVRSYGLRVLVASKKKSACPYLKVARGQRLELFALNARNTIVRASTSGKRALNTFLRYFLHRSFPCEGR